MQVYDYNGKHFIRMGECSNCGQCCLGWGAGPCPYLDVRAYGDTRCKIHDKFDSEWAQKEYEAGRIYCNPKGVASFPDGPKSLLSSPALLNSCSYYFIEIEKILVGCPTYEGKEYCMEEYVDSIQNLDYSGYDILLVDTSNTKDFYNRWKDKVNMVHIETGDVTPNKKIAMGMEHIRKYALKKGYDRWFSIEADVIVPSEMVSTMLGFDKNKDIDWISHTYPDRINPGNVMDGFGCTMFSRNLLMNESFDDAPGDTTTDGWYWNQKVKPKNYKTVDLWGVLRLFHRNGNNTTRDSNHIW